MMQADRVEDCEEETHSDRWWRFLKLPVEFNPREELRNKYQNIVQKFEQQSLDDPLQASTLQSRTAEIAKDLKEHSGLEENHPLLNSSVVSRHAHRISAVWEVEQQRQQDPQPYNPQIAVLAAVIVHQLFLDTAEDEVGSLDDSVEADAYYLLEAIARQLGSLLKAEASNVPSTLTNTLAETATSTGSIRMDKICQDTTALLANVDPPLNDHLTQTLNLQVGNWAQPWLTCLFARRFTLEGLSLIWDAVFEALSEDSNTQSLDTSATVLPSVLTAIMLSYKTEVEDLESPTGVSEVRLFTRVCESNERVREIVSQARLLRNPMLLVKDDESLRCVRFAEGPLGIILGQEEEGLSVRKFQYDKATGKMMQAEASGLVKIGDILHGINGVLVRPGISPQELVQFLLRLKRPLFVSFRPPSPLKSDPFSSDSLDQSVSPKPVAEEKFIVERTVITTTDDGTTLPTIAGEVYDARLKASLSHWHRPRICSGLEHVWIRGELFVSNYRLYFHPLQQDSFSTWQIPVHSVARADTQKQPDAANGRIMRSLTFNCKDGQVRRFTTSKPMEEDRQLADEFHRFLRKFYQWAYCGETELAKRHCTAWQLNPPPEVPEEHKLRFSQLADFERLGLNSYGGLRLVRQNEINLCITYPLELLFPSTMSDQELMAVSKYRSKQRLPVVTWFDVRTGASIARSAQPLVGMNSKRCLEDEKLICDLASLTLQVPNSRKRYYIVDARSKVATHGNRLMGKGVEQIKYYRGDNWSADVHYLNIGNIHAARESIDSLHQLSQPRALEESSSYFGKLDSTGWLSHVYHILKGSNFVVDVVSREKSGVLVHCSDGWDRTPQICCLAQMCLDPYYRTIHGLHTLIEKEWLGYGHKFGERCAHSTTQPSEEKSPVFTLWLDCVFQMMRQFPQIFEFNEKLLLALLDHLYSCRFGTFLSNSFIERSKHLSSDTLSIWVWIEQRYTEFINPSYERYTEGPVIPSTNPKNLVLWESYFQRFDTASMPIARTAPETFYD